MYLYLSSALITKRELLCKEHHDNIDVIMKVNGLPDGDRGGWKDLSDPEFCAEFIYGTYKGLRRR